MAQPVDQAIQAPAQQNVRGFPMEFHIRFSGPAPDTDVIEDTIRTVDASALVDIEPGGETLRIAASIGAGELAALISQTGFAVTPSQVTQLPSICCGGCSG